MINTRTAKAIAVIGLGIATASILHHRAVAAVEKRYSGHLDDDIVDALVVEDEMDDVVDALVMDDEADDVLTSIGETANGHILYRTIEPKDGAKGSRTYVRSRPFWIDDDGLRIYSER